MRFGWVKMNGYNLVRKKTEVYTIFFIQRVVNRVW